MDVPNQLSETNAGLELLHVAVGGSDRWRVDEHQIDTRHEKYSEQHRRDESKPERVTDTQNALGDLDRIEMKEEVAERLQGAAPWRVELRVAEHRTVRIAALDPRHDSAVYRRPAGLEVVEIDVSHE